MTEKRKPTDTSRKPKRDDKLSLYPLSVEDALRAAMQTGPAPSRVELAKKASKRKSR